MRRAAWAAQVITAALLASCSTPVVITSSGPTMGTSTGQFGRFQARYTAAANSQSDQESQDSIKLLGTGLALIDNNCRDYFRSEGRFQQTLYFVRDISNVLAPIAAGALAIGNTSAKATAILTLSTAATSSVISTVASDFLFNSDNIDDVQTLVMNDLAAHEEKVNQNKDSNPSAVNFDWVTTQLVDHQNHCTPAHILAITKQAIKNAQLLPENQGLATGGTTNAPSPKEVQDLESALATIIGQQINDDEAAALYWLVEMPDAKDYYKYISQKLQPLGSKSPFDTSGNLTAAWTQSAGAAGSPATRVKAAFEAIKDPSLKGKLETTVGSWLSALASAPPAAPGVPIAPVVLLPADLTPRAPAPTPSLPSHVTTRVVSPYETR
jgi:hypothetical protein